MTKRADALQRRLENTSEQLLRTQQLLDDTGYGEGKTVKDAVVAAGQYRRAAQRAQEKLDVEQQR